MNFVRPHAKLRKNKARCSTTSVLRNRHSALCQSLEFDRSMLRNDVCSVAPIHPPHASLSWAVLRADDSFFFAITGGLQMFGLHEAARGSSYVAPNILVCLSQLHKKGTLYLPPRKVAPPNSAKSDGAKLEGPKLETPKPAQAPLPPNSLSMKIFFAATALALTVSTCSGLMMGWGYARRKSIVLLTLAAGIVSPAILFFV
jgi:hypothetical protein